MHNLKSTRLIHHVEEMMRNQLGASGFNEAKLAGQLGMSLRSLQRRLKGQGCSYSSIIAKMKHEVACDRLRNSSESVRVIGKALGYADSSNFSRAFQRWEGCSPSDFRRKMS